MARKLMRWVCILLIIAVIVLAIRTVDFGPTPVALVDASGDPVLFGNERVYGVSDGWVGGRVVDYEIVGEKINDMVVVVYVRGQDGRLYTFAVDRRVDIVSYRPEASYGPFAMWNWLERHLDGCVFFDVQNGVIRQAVLQASNQLIKTNVRGVR